MLDLKFPGRLEVVENVVQLFLAGNLSSFFVRSLVGLQSCGHAAFNVLYVAVDDRLRIDALERRLGGLFRRRLLEQVRRFGPCGDGGFHQGLLVYRVSVALDLCFHGVDYLPCRRLYPGFLPRPKRCPA